jgi:hypothetical protein
MKINRTEPSQGCMVGGEAFWYYFEPKIPSQRLMCDLAHCRGEGTTCCNFTADAHNPVSQTPEYL